MPNFLCETFKFHAKFCLSFQQKLKNSFIEKNDKITMLSFSIFRQLKILYLSMYTLVSMYLMSAFVDLIIKFWHSIMVNL